MRVSDLLRAKRRGQCFAVELWIVTGLRDCPHIDEALNLVGAQKREEVASGTVRMADGENERLHKRPHRALDSLN